MSICRRCRGMGTYWVAYPGPLRLETCRECRGKVVKFPVRVAQLVERRSHKPEVGGSIPFPATIILNEGDK